MMLARASVKPVLALAAAALLALALPAWGQTFRFIQPILAPDATLRAAILNGGGTSVPGFKPVPREVVEAAVRKIYAAYNTPEFRQYLSERFYDPDRLVEALYEKVPREATLRLISVNSASTVSQERVKGDAGELFVDSLVLVVVRAQMEYTSTRGFQRREGESELVLRFRRQAK